MHGVLQVHDDGDVSELVSHALGDLDYWTGEPKNEDWRIQLGLGEMCKSHPH